MAYDSDDMATYEGLRRQTRTLESLVDAKLTAYSRIASSISLGHDLEAGGNLDRQKDLEHELEDLLEKVISPHSTRSSRGVC